MMTVFKDITRKSYAFDLDKFNIDPKWRLLEKLYSDFFPWVDKESKIPKIIHQIWVGPNEIPENYKVYMATWKIKNPDWQYKLWTDGNIQELNLPKLYFTIKNVGQKSDYLRYHILNKYGGIYADTDFECLASFDMFTKLEFFTGIGYPGSPELYIGLMGSIPNHPILQRIIRAMIVIRDGDWKDIFHTTGSYFFTKLFFNAVGEGMENVVAFPTDYFYCYPNNMRTYDCDPYSYITEYSFAIHHWGTSWMTKRPKR
jgi:mannosyltransferase OCH1-like enzyme